MNTKWHRKCSSKAPKGEEMHEMLKSVDCIKWSIWKNGLCYEITIGRCRRIVNIKIHKMVNVQEGQQHIITPQTASQLGFTGQMCLHIAQFHRVQMSTDHTDVTRGLQMNTGKTGITSTDTHEQEHPQNTLNLKTPSFQSI